MTPRQTALVNGIMMRATQAGRLFAAAEDAHCLGQRETAAERRDAALLAEADARTMLDALVAGEPVKETLGIVELMTQVGDADILYQVLLHDATSFEVRGKRGKHYTAITFNTNQITPAETVNGSSRKMGFVVWLPVDRVSEIREAHRQRVEAAKAAAAPAQLSYAGRAPYIDAHGRGHDRQPDAPAHSFGGIPIVTDDKMPTDEIRLDGPDGQVQGVIHNIKPEPGE